MPCTRHPGAVRRRGAELPAKLPRWPMDDAGCTAGSCRGRRAETPLPGSMAFKARPKAKAQRSPCVDPGNALADGRVWRMKEYATELLALKLVNESLGSPAACAARTRGPGLRPASHPISRLLICGHSGAPSPPTQRWVSLNSMRRLRLKAAIVLPGSIGWTSPNPVAASRPAGTPRSIRYLTTAAARPVESSQFDG